MVWYEDKYKAIPRSRSWKVRLDGGSDRDWSSAVTDSIHNHASVATSADLTRFEVYANALTAWASKTNDASLNQLVMLAREVRHTSEDAARKVDGAITEAMCIALMTAARPGGESHLGQD